MEPPESFSTAAPQSSSAFCSGCDAGTQCDSFSSKVFSCAIAGDTRPANSSAAKAFFIEFTPSGQKGALWSAALLLNMLYITQSAFKTKVAPRPHRAARPLYDITTSVCEWRPEVGATYSIPGSKYCGQKSQSSAPDRRGCCLVSCCTLTESTT